MSVQITSSRDTNYTDITVKQAFGLGVIQVLINRNPDLPPTLSDIARHLNVRKQTADQLLVILERKGYILRSRGAIRLTSKELPYATKGRAA